jgi:hypothetical protein
MDGDFLRTLRRSTCGGRAGVVRLPPSCSRPATSHARGAPQRPGAYRARALPYCSQSGIGCGARGGRAATPRLPHRCLPRQDCAAVCERWITFTNNQISVREANRTSSQQPSSKRKKGVFSPSECPGPAKCCTEQREERGLNFRQPPEICVFSLCWRPIVTSPTIKAKPKKDPATVKTSLLL